MLKINKKVEYALMALKFIALKDSSSLTSAREICDEFKTPFDTTAKVLQIMNTKGILSSVKGIKGGYLLNKDLAEISYLQLTKIIEAKNEKAHPCDSHKGKCELYGSCNIIDPVGQLNLRLNQFLEQLSLGELLLGDGLLLRSIELEQNAIAERINTKS